MLFLLMGAALGVGCLAGVLTFRLTRRLRMPLPSRVLFFSRALAAWFVGLSIYAIVTETYRPILSLTWIREAIWGGDLIPITVFSCFLAFSSLRWWGPSSGSNGQSDAL